MARVCCLWGFRLACGARSPSGDLVHLHGILDKISAACPNRATAEILSRQRSDPPGRYFPVIPRHNFSAACPNRTTAEKLWLDSVPTLRVGT